MNDLIVTTDESLAAGGAALARHPDGRIVFVDGAAPAERVRVRITKDNPRFLRARVVEIVEPSVHRVSPECAHVAACGGCTLQHVSAQAQLRSKQAALMTTLEKIGQVRPAEVLEPWSGAPYGYRGRVRWAVAADGRLGYREAKGRRVTVVDQCPVLHPALQAIQPELSGPSTAGRTHLSAVTDARRVAASWTGPAGARPARSNLVWSGPVSDPASTLESDGVWLHPLVFSQANPAGNRALRAQLAEWFRAWAPIAGAVELYAGSANLTLELARWARTVSTFEASADAVSLARRVLPDHVRAAVATAEAAAAGTNDPVDVILVDPPRAGLSTEVGRALVEWATRAIVYVSCDPATFARDAGRFRAAGWALRQIRLFDLYPQTPHVEVAAWFSPSVESPLQ